MISIIIPVHNGEKTLLKAINSALIQGVEKEIIIIDDFSTDNSINIAKSANVDKILEVKNFGYKKSTGAPNIPRNLGVKAASGNLIALLDQDDWWEPGKLKAQLRALELYNSNICSTSFIAHNIRNNTKRLHGNNTNKIVYVPNMFERFIKRDKSKQTLMSTMLFEKAIYPQMDEKKGLTDFLWTAKLLEGNRLVSVEHPLMNRLVTGKNASFNSVLRKVTLKEQIETMSYYEKKYGYDLIKEKKESYASYARYNYQAGNYKEARKYLKLSPITKKNIAYYLTSYIPFISRFVCKRFNVFGDN